jgi:hypothetical protein
MNAKVYWANVVICISVIIFCGVKVMLDPEPTTTSIYLPIMSGIVGYFVPNPTKKKDNQDINQLVSSNSSSEGIIRHFGAESSINSIPQSPPLSPAQIPHIQIS